MSEKVWMGLCLVLAAVLVLEHMLLRTANRMARTADERRKTVEAELREVRSEHIARMRAACDRYEDTRAREEAALSRVRLLERSVDVLTGALSRSSAEVKK